MFKKRKVKIPLDTGKLTVSATQIIVFSFLGVILTGTLLLMLPFATRDGSISFLDSLFTATSATCVTGLVAFDTYTKFTFFGQAVILFMIQIGGLGLVTFTTFFGLILGRRLGLSSLKLASENISSDNFSQTASFIRLVVRVTFVCEAAGALLLMPVFIPQFGPKGIWLSAFTSVSAFCNAGFDLFGSLGAYSSLTPYARNPYVLAVISFLIIGGGLGFVVWHDFIVLKKQNRRLNIHSRLVIFTSIILIVLGAVLFGLIEWNNPATLGNLSFFDKITNSLFQSITTRTAGFNSVDLSQTNASAKIIMSLLMFIGAAPGGTGGGIKITTAAMLIVAVISVIRGREEATLFGKQIKTKIVYRALAIAMLSAVAVSVAALSIYFSAGGEFSAVDSIFEATSAFGTVGLSLGAIGYIKSAAKVVIILTMFIGRVGPVTLAMSLAVRLSNVKKELLPEGHILIG